MEHYLSYNLQYFADGPGGEKTEEPTSKKLSDARKEGKVAQSKDVVSSLTLLSLFIILKIWTGKLAEGFLEVFSYVYNEIPSFTKLIGGQVAVNDYTALMHNMYLKTFVLVLPFLLCTFVISVVGDLFQVKWKPTLKPLQPKMNKLNPVSGIRNLFNVQTLVELLKSIVKIIIMIFIVYSEIKDKMFMILTLYDMPLITAVITAGDVLINIGLKISAFFMLIAFIDYLYQRWKFNKDMRMTKQEVKDEYKNAEGDPQIKGKIRRKMQEASQRRMMQNLPKADVVITNPTHFAVAIVYDKDMADAPIVLAKGADYLAQKIKDKARECDISIVENKPLARSLYATVEVGEAVPPELYVAVAEVLAAVYKATGRV